MGFKGEVAWSGDQSCEAATEHAGGADAVWNGFRAVSGGVETQTGDFE